MRRFLIVAVAVVTACSSTQELAPTPPTTSASPTTSSVDIASTTTALVTTTTTTPVTTTTLPELQALAYEEVARADFPIQIVPRNPAESLLATKAGRVFTFDGSSISDAPILDINEKVRNEGERGLLSMAVHPEDDSRLFVHYSANDGDTVVEEYRIGETDAVQQLLRLNQPARNHNGGMIQFGPGDDLYLGLGDGGGSNDRFGNGQNTSTLLGGLVRIDVDDPDPHLFQYGLRNPWRFWIDGELIYVADVGQGSFEEVSVAPLVGDVNYGWPITEGLHCFRPSSGCETDGLHLPEIEVSHGDSGTCSITGGLVYRGAAIPEIQGMFFYSDFCGGYLRSFRHLAAGGADDQRDWTDEVGRVSSVASFGVDHTGEIYVLASDAILKVVPVR